MKSALSGFLVTALLLSLHVVPSAEQLEAYASPTDRAFAERHAQESTQQLRAELGLPPR
jgi:hypothetical protein